VEHPGFRTDAHTDCRRHKIHFPRPAAPHGLERSTDKACACLRTAVPAHPGCRRGFAARHCRRVRRSGIRGDGCPRIAHQITARPDGSPRMVLMFMPSRRTRAGWRKVWRRPLPQYHTQAPSIDGPDENTVPRGIRIPVVPSLHDVVPRGTDKRVLSMMIFIGSFLSLFTICSTASNLQTLNIHRT